MDGDEVNFVRRFPNDPSPSPSSRLSPRPALLPSARTLANSFLPGASPSIPLPNPFFSRSSKIPFLSSLIMPGSIAPNYVEILANVNLLPHHLLPLSLIALHSLTYDDNGLLLPFNCLWVWPASNTTQPIEPVNVCLPTCRGSNLTWESVSVAIVYALLAARIRRQS